MKRLLFALCAAALTATTAFAGSFAGEAGLQLYSLRDAFKKDVPGTLDLVQKMGIKQVELAGTYDMAPADFLKALSDRGLKAISSHFPYKRYATELPKVVADAKALGLEYAGLAWIDHEPGNFSMEVAKKAAADFNAWGAAMKEAGVKFFYHCHGYEFRPVEEGGAKTFMDVLLEETKPDFVAFEMDVFWVVHPGADPVKYLTKYPGRWQLMHLKDIQKGARTGVYTGHAPNEQCVPLGTGQVAWAPLLEAAAKNGARYYFIEDEHPKAAEQIPQSLKFLQTLK